MIPFEENEDDGWITFTPLIKLYSDDWRTYWSEKHH